VDLRNLNRRHKAGPLLVLAGAGVCLVMDASAKQTASRATPRTTVSVGRLPAV
jgi:hypothetical protein